MRIPRFYTPKPVLAQIYSGSVDVDNASHQAALQKTITLDAAVARHMVQVLRLKVGSPLIVFDGCGGEYRAVIDQVAKHSVDICLQEFVDNELESGLEICLAQGVSRGERMDYTVQKAVELGVTEIVPLKTERTVVNLKGDHRDRRKNHWQKIVNSACEQCGRNTVPSVLPVDKFINWVADQGVESEHNKSTDENTRLKIMLHHEAEHGFSSLQDLSAGPNMHVTFLVGPEGGLSEEECELASKAGFVSVRLGPRVLRTETAALAAISVMQSIWGDMG